MSSTCEGDKEKCLCLSRKLLLQITLRQVYQFLDENKRDTLKAIQQTAHDKLNSTYTSTLETFKESTFCESPNRQNLSLYALLFQDLLNALATFKRSLKPPTNINA